MKKLIKILCNAIILLMPTLAAAQVANEEGVSLMVWLFMGFGALIIVFQLFPGLALFVIMLREIFARAPGKGPVIPMEKAKEKV